MNIKVRFKPYVINYIKSHPDFDSPNVRSDHGMHYCTIKLDDCGLSYSRDFDEPYFIVVDEPYTINRKYVGDSEVEHYYKILQPEKLYGFSIAEKHVYKQEPFKVDIEDKLFEI